MIQRHLLLSTLLMGLSSLPIGVAGATDGESGPAAPVPSGAVMGIRLLDVAGKVQEIGERDGTRAVALVFLSPECPVSNQYIPELNRIFREFKERPVEFFGVLADPTLARVKAAQFVRDFGVEFPVLDDSAGVLAAACEPTHVPEAFVFDSIGRLLYRGRIDDQFASVGKRRSVVSEHNLADTLAAVLDGRTPAAATPVTGRATDPVGCRLQPLAPPKDVTFARHVVPILYSRCAGCHRPGEVAPFSLLSFDDAAKRADFLAEVTGQRRMPPWTARPQPVHASFRGERRLTEREIATLAAWAKEGAAKRGAAKGEDADLPPVPDFSDGWQLGEPDLVLAMPEPYRVPASGPDIFRFFVMPIDIPENKVVSAVEFRAGNPRVVHHAILYLDRSGVARKRDEADPEPGYAGFLTGGFRPSGTLGFWAPGYTPRFFPSDVGQWLATGTDLAMQLHYHPSGKEELDQSQVGIHFADKPVDRYVGGFAMIDFRVDIPPGVKDHKMAFDFVTPVDIEIMDVTPHMHMIGTEMKVRATTPGGEEIPLVWSDWDFNWQDQYLYREPVKLPAGTKIQLEASYDNSADNPANPNKPPARVGLGEMTTDEMCICAFHLITNQEREQRGELRKALGISMRRQLLDPKVMKSVMDMVTRGSSPGDGPKLSDLLGTAGAADPGSEPASKAPAKADPPAGK